MYVVITMFMHVCVCSDAWRLSETRWSMTEPESGSGGRSSSNTIVVARAVAYFCRFTEDCVLEFYLVKE